MKNTLLILLALPVLAFSQVQKGVTPIAQSTSQTTNTTRAVVIGISDYQDPGIPDLRFADKDAEAFANFLRSPAGGSLDNDHLQVLTNQQATAGRIAEALDNLIEKAKEGDQVIIYFSGHGDVEGKKISQPGFLLCWDAPSRVYMGGGTYSLSFLQEVVTTLSVQSKAKVLVITDACHAGKLAGSQIGGAQLTTANLAKQYANEVKILSCQPNEFSLEGDQWGGGHGCFSYHLVDGLYGLADRNGDGTVTVGEMDRYLEDHVTAEAAPQSQAPMLLGNKTERLASVNAAMLADLKKSKAAGMPVFAATEGRGFEEEILQKADSTILQLYLSFKKAVKEKRFFEPEADCAEKYYAQLSKNETLTPLYGMMKRNYAAALIDDGQQFVNQLLKTDSKAFDKFFNARSDFFGQLADQTNRASELLGEKHYFYNSLKAKEYYFRYLQASRMSEAVVNPIAIANTRNDFLYTALSYEPDAPYLVYSMARSAPLDSADFYIRKLTQIAPTWVMWYTSMAMKIQYSDPARAIALYKKSIELDSAYWAAYNHITEALEIVGQQNEANKYYGQVIHLLYGKIAAGATQVTSDEWVTLGSALIKMKRYREAGQVLNHANQIAGGFYYFSYVNLANLLFCTHQDETLVDSLRRLEKQIGRQPFCSSLGIAYTHLGDFEKARLALLSATDPTDIGLRDLLLLNVYRKTGSYKEALARYDSMTDLGAVDYFDRSEFETMSGDTAAARLSLDSFLLKITIRYRKNQWGPNGYENKIIALYRLGRVREMRQAIEEANKALNGDAWHHYRMACAFAQIGQPTQAFQQLSLAEQSGWSPLDFFSVYGNFYDPYLDPLRPLPAFQDWAKRWSPPYHDESKN